MAQKKKRKKKKRQSFYDYSLLFAVIFLCCFGLVMVFSTSYYTAGLQYGDTMYYARKQAVFMLAGLLLMLVISKLDYHWLRRLAIPAWFISFLLMVMTNYVPGFGKEVNGQKRWFMISGHALFQTSEIVKITIIIAMAVLLVRLGKKVDSFRGVAWALLVVAPLDLLVLSKNLSTGIIIFGVAFIMFFVASRRRVLFGVLAGLAAGAAVIAVNSVEKLVDIGILEPYQVSRILAWQNPEAYSATSAMQTLQGLYAIGSGGLFGKGLGNSIQKLGFVPEAQNDMIFSIICEELGLFGALCVILLFLFLIYRLFVIARNAPDMFGFMLVVGVMGHISLQVMLNIAVVTNFIPNTGVTLPFFSYGGTAVLFLMIEMGIALSVSNRIVINDPKTAATRRRRAEVSRRQSADGLTERERSRIRRQNAAAEEARISAQASARTRRSVSAGASDGASSSYDRSSRRTSRNNNRRGS